MSTATLPTLPYSLERVVTIQAPPETVFAFFQDSARWAKWWGLGSTIDATPGGDVHIRHPGNVESAGKVLEIEAPRRIVFTYGFVSGDPIPAGSSRVTIELQEQRGGTRLVLTHDLPAEKVRDDHVQGWRFQLSLFANVVADEVNANAARYVDLWFQGWGDPSIGARMSTFREIATPAVRTQDRFSNLDGMDDLLAHLTAAQRFMPGLTLTRRGDVRHCQGMVLADWVVTGLDGTERGKGTNVFVFAPSGKIEWVTGFWG
jgi:uncharacterized protein YndB with AHSA1/START domain